MGRLWKGFEPAYLAANSGIGHAGVKLLLEVLTPEKLAVGGRCVTRHKGFRFLLVPNNR